ncbi:hypothetical protein N9O69_02410 [Alphaproteobacteria bacterium]|nr:hypothetical protein [Alphaproteobacteria bacterium]
MKIKIMLTILLLSTFLNPALATSIENMERTRSALISIMLDVNMNADKKQNQLNNFKLKLLDNERIVINDKKIIQNPDRYTIKAFEEFELSFLVHASIEKNLDISEHWFNQIGLTTSNLENTRLIIK